ncbi:MAG: redoxin domain-containing protein [Cyclobacteriaceae bacterium]|nr:MAG: redoxin domain-containing protein [Cyclobacteriaceae bacterium]
MKNLMVLILFLVANVLSAQEIKDFSLTNTRDGKVVTLSGLGSVTGVAVVFTSHDCPFDNYYKERLKELTSQYAGKIQFVLINSNQEPQENVEQMAIHYNDINVPYLADKDQVAMEALGARKSTEVFLISKAGGKLNLVYNGAIDDNPQVAKDVKQQFLKDAIEKLLAGQKIDVTNQRASGCTIRRK